MSAISSIASTTSGGEATYTTSRGSWTRISASGTASRSPKRKNQTNRFLSQRGNGHPRTGEKALRRAITLRDAERRKGDAARVPLLVHVQNSPGVSVIHHNMDRFSPRL